MYFHNDQKIAWDRELARTICNEFFSVRRAPWLPLFIYHSGVHRATADKCKMMLCLLPDCWDTMQTVHCSPSSVLPSAPTPQRLFLAKHMGAIRAYSLPSDVQVTLTTGDLPLPQMEHFALFWMIPSLGPVKSFVTT